MHLCRIYHIFEKKTHKYEKNKIYTVYISMVVLYVSHKHTFFACARAA